MSQSTNQSDNQSTNQSPPPGAGSDLVDWSVADKPSTKTNPLGFVWDLPSNPCFRSSLMWGIGIGGAMGVHDFARYRIHVKAANRAVGTFLAVSSVTWLWCRYQARQEKKLFDAVVDAELAKKQKMQATMAAKQQQT